MVRGVVEQWDVSAADLIGELCHLPGSPWCPRPARRKLPRFELTATRVLESRVAPEHRNRVVDRFGPTL